MRTLFQAILTRISSSFFKTLVDHEVTVELKNDIQIRGTLKSVDQYLNIKLDDITVVEEIKYPHLVGYGFVLGNPLSIGYNSLVLLGYHWGTDAEGER
jgi:small nuclear ribonucleoprotein (snRNP)-like protein